MSGADQEFLVAAAAKDWRSDLAADGRARFLDKFPDLSDRLGALCRIAHDAAFAYRPAPCLELRLN
jgi:hypothetical protein